MVVTFQWLGMFKRRSPMVIRAADGTTRHPAAAKSLHREAYGCKTAWELVERSCRSYGAKRALGVRGKSWDPLSPLK